MAAMIEILISKHKGEAVWFFLIEIADLRIADSPYFLYLDSFNLGRITTCYNISNPKSNIVKCPSTSRTRLK
jgi:hypothetical protein